MSSSPYEQSSQGRDLNSPVNEDTSKSQPIPGVTLSGPSANNSPLLNNRKAVRFDKGTPRTEFNTASKVPHLDIGQGTQRLPHVTYNDGRSMTSTEREDSFGDNGQPQDPDEKWIIPPTISYTLHVTCSGDSKLPKSKQGQIAWLKPGSYQKIEEDARQIAQMTCIGSDEGKELIFRYGYCTVYGGGPETKRRFGLTSDEQWDYMRKQLIREYTNGGPKKHEFTIHQEYLKLKLRVQSSMKEQKPFPRIKCWELKQLVKRNIDDQEYIPEADLQKFLSDHMIIAMIIFDPCWASRPSKEQSEALLSKIVQKKARKLLALCVYADINMKCLERLIDMGHHDYNFPKKVDTCCEDHRDYSENLTRLHGIFKVAGFWKLGQHQSFDSQVTVPILPKDASKFNQVPQELSRSSGDIAESPVGGRSTAKERASIGGGAQGCVYRVRLDPQHHRLSDDPFTDFALKEFMPKPKGPDVNFDKESTMLQSLRDFPHPHLTTHLVTWTQDGKCFMLFPLAKCNLHEYMSTVVFNHTKDETIWLLSQFKGLSSALEQIHDLTFNADKASNLGLTPLPQQSREQKPGDRKAGERKAGWHHDLKAQNILYVEEVNLGVRNFQIADFGSSKIHNFRSHSHPTRTTTGTITYEPPELEEYGETSRPHDVWSLGCVFLELLVWAHFGFASITTFEDDRLRQRPPGSSNSDTGFWEKRDGAFVLREAVTRWIDDVRQVVLKRPHQPFKELLDVVVDMFEVKRETRITAPEVHHQISKIYRQKKVELDQDTETRKDNNEGSDASAVSLNISNTSRRPSVAESFTDDPSSFERMNVSHGGEFQPGSPTNTLQSKPTRAKHHYDHSANDSVYSTTKRSDSISSTVSGRSVSRYDLSGARNPPSPQSPKSSHGPQKARGHSAKSSTDSSKES